jgi:hypothetical protein
MTFAKALLVLLFLPAVSAQADNHCGKTVALLGSESGAQGESSRDEVLTQIADLYSLAINDKAPLGAAQSLIQELAEREGKTFGEILTEIESMQASPLEKRAKAEERRAIREAEQSRLLEGLEPYLYPIGRDDRKVIEDTLIRPGLVYPLVIGEVEFRFRGTHRFVVGDEGFGEDSGRKRSVSFGPGDNFAIGQVPVTQLLYFLAALGEKGVAATPSGFKEGVGAVVLRLEDRTYSLKPNHPVEEVNYYDAMAHAGRVSKLTGIANSLPSELQWEFANRAGSESEYHFGADEAQLAHYGWFRENAAGWQTHAVGQLWPNAFHLYDTHGNVWEWTSSLDGLFPVIRGGCFGDGALHLYSAHRLRSDPYQHRDYRGFRLARENLDGARPSHTFTLGEPAPEADPASSPSTSLRSFSQRLLDRFRRFGK